MDVQTIFALGHDSSQRWGLSKCKWRNHISVKSYPWSEVKSIAKKLLYILRLLFEPFTAKNKGAHLHSYQVFPYVFAFVIVSGLSVIDLCAGQRFKSTAEILLLFPRHISNTRARYRVHEPPDSYPAVKSEKNTRSNVDQGWSLLWGSDHLVQINPVWYFRCWHLLASLLQGLVLLMAIVLDLCWNHKCVCCLCKEGN